VPGAVANLDRVRTHKRAAREAATAARHERILAAARRRAHLAAAGARSPSGNAQHRPAKFDRHDRTPVPPLLLLHRPPSAGVVTTHEGSPACGPGDESASGAVKVPALAATLTQWAQTWVKMCADGDLALGPINDEGHARTRYDLSAKQLRNIRNAAVSGALRRRANELGVQLPTAYNDSPQHRRTNGYG